MTSLMLGGRRATPRTRKFVPQGPGETTGARLEPRELAAAMFWRYPVSGAPTPDYVKATVGGVACPYTYITNDGSATVGGQSLVHGWDMMNMPTVDTFEIDAVATSQFNDGAAMPANSTPTGLAGVSLNTVDQVAFARYNDASRTTGWNNSMVATSEGTHSFHLANSSSADSPNATLVEHYNVHIQLPQYPDAMTSAGGNVSTSTGFVVSLGSGGILSIDGNSTMLALGSGSATVTNPMTGGGYSYDYSRTASMIDLNVYQSTNYTSLPTQSGSTNTEVGPNLTVQYYSSFTTGQQRTPPNTTDTGSISTTYDAHFA